MNSDKSSILKSKRLFLLDMDGTIFLDNNLFDGTLELLDYIKQIGGRHIFLTNNSSKSVSDYVKKLKHMGINADKNDFLTSLHATEKYLYENHRNEKMYVLGTASMKKELSLCGFNVTDTYSEDITCLVMGFDTELCFQKLEDACRLLNKGVSYIATNPDLVCPTWYGYVPDCGSVSLMLYNATKRKPKFIGKPEKQMIDLAIEKTGFSREQTLLIGDRLYTDIGSAVNAKATSVLVLSGESTIADIDKSEYKPDFIFKDVKEIYNILRDNAF